MNKTANEREVVTDLLPGKLSLRRRLVLVERILQVRQSLFARLADFFELLYMTSGGS